MDNVPLNSLEGVTPELVPLLEAAGYTTLSDVLDLEREDVERVPGMSPELADQMMAFLAELTGDEAADEGAPPA